MANSISGKDGKREMICSFCGRSQSQVDQLIIGPGVNICKDCIDMCYSIRMATYPNRRAQRRNAVLRLLAGIPALTLWRMSTS